jgi:hypothetical protein
MTVRARANAQPSCDCHGAVTGQSLEAPELANVLIEEIDFLESQRTSIYNAAGVVRRERRKLHRHAWSGSRDF